MPHDLSIMQRFKDAKSDKDKWRDMYEKVYSLALPFRNQYNEKTEGQDKATEVYDSTLYSSMLRSANTLQSGIAPPFQKWANYILGPLAEAMSASDDQKVEAQKVLNGRRDVAFAALDSSNFNSVMAEFLLELLIGTGIMKVEKGRGDQILEVSCVPGFGTFIEEGIPGMHTALFRSLRVKGRNIESMWPDAKLEGDLAEFVKNNANKDIDITDITYTNLGDPGNEWFYEVFITKSGGDSNERIVQRQIPRFPFIITHWMKVSGETYGRGPAMYAYHEAAMLNETRRLVLENAELAISPPLLVREDGVLSSDQITLDPMGVNIVSDTSGSARGAAIEPLELGSRFDIAQFIIKDMEANIRKMMMDVSLPPDDVGARSATEIVARQSELSNDKGAPFGRIQQNFVRPLFSNVDAILVDIGMIEDSAGLKIDGNIVDVQVTAPLAQVQNFAEIERLVKALEISNGLLGEETTQMGFKTEDMPRWLGSKVGLEPDLMRSEAEVIEFQKNLAKIQAAQMGQGQGAPADGAEVAV